ncbi:type II secretion system F family protein [Oleomonas cavernae]|uniref:Type II secretion system F family protein n=1 Tax=Oleomonas cavernae TaxID=2320859 RepID=A0A418WD37_9PROT|nr:type II secretion system F family protein [Oleomonas cavernae]RJF87951.1 type II secretion system F family protein [Oleomonas cavernae]
MKTFRYRAIVPATGEIRVGTVEGRDRDAVVETLRVAGLVTIEAAEGGARAAGPVQVRVSGALRKALPDVIGQIAVLLEAGLPLDRALAITADNTREAGLATAVQALRERVKGGTPLARAMAEAGGLFSPMAIALAEAGETSGQLGPTLSRLAASLERQEALRQTVRSALFYPAMLLVVAVGVILIMLLVVVPQFETLFADLGGNLPPMTAIVVGISQFVRAYGLVALLGGAAALVLVYRWFRRPEMRAIIDRRILRVPLFGRLVVEAETARFSRTLGALVDSGVALPVALAIAARTFANSHMAGAVHRVVAGLHEGGGLAGPLAATGVFPRLAIGFLRTGEETAQLGSMLGRLADVLDREVRNTTQRLITLMTPLLTVVLGVIVAGVIAAIMSAILGVNDLALQS